MKKNSIGDVKIVPAADLDLFVLRFYGPVNQWGHVERGQFT